jgi:glycerol dehydrogenase
MAIRIFAAPSRYVQGPDALAALGEQLQIQGIANPLILASKNGRKAVEPALTKSLFGCGIKYSFIDFGGACTRKEVERIKQACLDGGHDAIVNCGGGKTLDAGRCAAAGTVMDVMKVPPERIDHFGADVPCVNIPTVAATDAATSASSLVHNEDGAIEAIISLATNPLMVFVDTTVIARSPVRLLVAGMGDALATCFEADMCFRTLTPTTSLRALSTRTALALGKLCFEIVMEYGVKATIEAKAGVAGPAMEAVAEANILLSGLGFQNGGLSVAHAVGNAFEHIAGSFGKPRFHGETVAFGTLVQLVLESREPSFLDGIFGFYKAVGLPTTFDELTLDEPTDEILETLADVASRDMLIRSMSGASKERDGDGRFFDRNLILNALKTVDAYGRSFVA